MSARSLPGACSSGMARSDVAETGQCSQCKALQGAVLGTSECFYMRLCVVPANLTAPLLSILDHPRREVLAGCLVEAQSPAAAWADTNLRCIAVRHRLQC